MDGPCTGVTRQAMNFNNLQLTDFTIKISRSAREKQVRKAYEAADINNKWEQTAWAKRIAQKVRRRQLTDFDRYKLRVLRQQVILQATYSHVHAIISVKIYSSNIKHCSCPAVIALILLSHCPPSLCLSLSHTHVHTHTHTHTLEISYCEGTVQQAKEGTVQEIDKLIIIVKVLMLLTSRFEIIAFTQSA